MIRTILQLALTFSLSLLALSSAHAKCTGQNILPRLKADHPKIMSDVRSAANRISNTNAILWQVEKAGLKPSHLFGTMHVSDARVAEMPEPVVAAIEGSRIVALELGDMSPMAMMKAVAKLPQLMVYVDGSRLDKKLSEDEFKTVSNVLQKVGMPPQMTARVRPWLVSLMVALPECEAKRVASGQKALDMRVADLAKDQEIPVMGLETVESQLKSMAAIPDTDQVAMLRSSLAFFKDREDLFETLIQSYLKRDIGMVLALSAGMAKLAGLKESGFDGFNRELIKKRNHSMFDSSLPLVDQGGAFIAVGAAHLIGETGLVALYRKAGFTVTAIN